MDKMIKGIVYCCILLACGMLGCASAENNNDESDMIISSSMPESSENECTTEIIQVFSEKNVEMEKQEKIPQVSGAMVQVVSGSGMGSGVIYKETEDDWIVVTAGHVLEDKNSVFVVFDDEIGTASDVVSLAKDSDLAFLQVKKEKVISKISGKNYSVSVDKAAYDDLQIGDWVKAVGSYHEISGDFCEGIVKEKLIFAKSLQEMVLLADMKCFSGMSGGGVFDKEGHFMGIVCAVDENEETAVIPLITILAKELELFSK